MILLRLISWPYARKHLLRSLLTTAGIVLGVAVFVGMHTANQSVLAAFRQTIDRIAGMTQLQVSAGEPGFDEDVDDPLVFLAQPDSLMVTKTFADERGLKIDSRIPMRTMEGDRVFTVRGIMKPGGLASAFGGNLAVMDIYAAQKIFGRGRKFDRIDLVVKEGLRVADVQRQISTMLGGGFQVESPSARGQQFEAMAQVYSVAANITSSFALFIGMF